MNDAISRSALIEFFEKAKEYPDNLLRNLVFLDGVLSVIDSAPALDVAPVVHARWQDHHCTECWTRCMTAKTLQDFVINVETPYCPLCGARMDGDADAV